MRYNRKDMLEYWAKVSDYQSKSRCTLRRRMGDVINHDNNHEQRNYSSFFTRISIYISKYVPCAQVGSSSWLTRVKKIFYRKVLNIAGIEVPYEV